MNRLTIDNDALRERYEERAAILEYDANMTRPDAEREAMLMVYGEESEHALATNQRNR